MSTPKRIQRKRTKGWRMPEGAVYVGRPSRWGNPWRADDFVPFMTTLVEGVIRAEVPEYEIDQERAEKVRAGAHDAAVTAFAEAVHEDREHQVPDWYPTVAEIRSALRGRDLACWCPLDQPCHADVLLEIANQATHSTPTEGDPA